MLLLQKYSAKISFILQSKQEPFNSLNLFPLNIFPSSNSFSSSKCLATKRLYTRFNLSPSFTLIVQITKYGKESAYSYDIEPDSSTYKCSKISHLSTRYIVHYFYGNVNVKREYNCLYSMLINNIYLDDSEFIGLTIILP